VELACRVAGLLLRIHHGQLVATPGARHTLLRLHRRLRPALQSLKDAAGVNIAALSALRRSQRENAGVGEGDAVLPAKRRLLGGAE
jgi:U3 small nucleolar RNA-associated protein 12